MASDFNLVDPSGWELDLHSVYSAYMGYFQLHNVAWYERSWASLFTSFDAFLAFGWPVVVVTDARTGRPHIVTRLTSVGAFVKMVKTRFGEVLPPVTNIMMVQPFETTQRHLRQVTDSVSYKKLYSTLPAAALAARRARVRQGDVAAIRKLWDARDSVWLAVSAEVSERSGNINAWGYAVLRAAHLDGSGVWPPDPVDNYRKGHYVTIEALERKTLHSLPRDYVWADSSVVPRAKLPDIVGAIVSSLAGPESESQPNPLVVVMHGEVSGFAELKVKLPNNAFTVDIQLLERHMYAQGLRGNMMDPSAPPPGRPRSTSSTLSLTALMRTLDADLTVRGAPAHIAGNDALATLLALQLLMGARPQTGAPSPLRPRFAHAPHSAGLLMRPPVVPYANALSIPPSPSTGSFRGAALLTSPGSPRRGQAQSSIPGTPSGSLARRDGRERGGLNGVDDLATSFGHLQTSSHD